MQLRVLAEGSTKFQRFIKHWGLSILIDDDILFDAFGKPSYLIKQFKKLNADIGKIKYIVLSHDDWDHVSGLWYILEKNKNVIVCICPNFSQEIKEKIRACGVTIIEIKGFQQICKGVYSTGEMPGNSEKRTIYEQSLVLESDKGLVIITGCAHQGILRIVETIKNRFKQKIYLLIGGMHLKDSSRQDIADVILKLKEYDIEKIAPMHCTGRCAARLMQKEFKDNFIRVKQGKIVQFFDRKYE